MSSETPKPGNKIHLDEVSPRRVAQTLVEMDFALSLLPCSECGAYERDPRKYGTWAHPLEDDAHNSLYTSYCKCPGCHEQRQLVSWTVNNPPISCSWLHLVGDSPSQIIEPWQFVTEIDRLRQTISLAPAELKWKTFYSNSDELDRALLCANELRKFIVEGEYVIAQGEYTERGRAHRAANQHRYQSTEVVAIHAELESLNARYIEEVPRIHTEELAEKGPPKVPVGNLDRDAMMAHEAWLARGRTGDGRLILKHQDIVDTNMPHVEGALFEGVKFSGVRAFANSFAKSEILDVTFERSNLQTSNLKEAKVETSTFVGCNINLVHFDGATINKSKFSQCELARTRWLKAVVTASSFDDVMFHDAKLDGIKMSACDLRGNYFGASNNAQMATTVNARFEDCDFRGTGWRGRDLSGATFIRCKFAGSRGVPRAHSGLSLRDCDVTLAEFLTMLAIVDPPPTKAADVPTYPALPTWLNAALLERIGPESASNPTLRLLDRTLIARTPSGHRFVATLEKVTADPAAAAHFALLTLTIQETPSGITIYDVERRREMPAAGRLNTTIAVALT
jgi:uncharacterized protein YjbI with pentapeptide repeats